MVRNMTREQNQSYTKVPYQAKEGVGARLAQVDDEVHQREGAERDVDLQSKKGNEGQRN